MMRILADLESVSNAAAELVVRQAQTSIDVRGRFSLVLSGGSTPRRLYELLAADQFRTSVEWEDVHIFWGDERCVPPDDRRSNERLAREAFLDHVAIPPEQIHPIRCATSAEDAAQAYELCLKEFFGEHSPSFDTVLLGLGEDGHTASLFPGSPALKETKRWVAVSHNDKESFARVTMTAAAINHAALIIFLVAGREKAKILLQATAREVAGNPLPARLIRPSSGQLVWLVDKEAGGIR